MSMVQRLKSGWDWIRYVRVVISVVVGLWVSMQIAIAPASATGIYELPSVIDDSTWVVDEADILSRLTESNVNQALNRLAKQTGQDVHFVTIHRLDYGETIDSFTDQLFERWFPTADAQANQTLLVLDNVTNTAAIRMGDALKAQLTDAIAESVAQETLMVPIRQGNKYNQAFADASDRLIAVLSGEPDPGPPVIEVAVNTEGTFATPEETKGSNATVWVIGLLIAATVIPMATYYLYQIIQS